MTPADAHSHRDRAAAPSAGEPEAPPPPSAHASEHLRIRAELMEAVRAAIKRRGLRQRDAAALFGVAQPRVSDLVRDKRALFSIDTLVDMLAALGVRVELRLRSSAPKTRLTGTRDEAVRKVPRRTSGR